MIRVLRDVKPRFDEDLSLSMYTKPIIRLYIININRITIAYLIIEVC